MKTRYPDLKDINLDSVTEAQKAKIRKYGREFLTDKQKEALKIFKECLKNMRAKKVRYKPPLT